jgi:hypothetical protein
MSIYAKNRMKYEEIMKRDLKEIVKIFSDRCYENLGHEKFLIISLKRKRVNGNSKMLKSIKE